MIVYTCTYEIYCISGIDTNIKQVLDALLHTYNKHHTTNKNFQMVSFLIDDHIHVLLHITAWVGGIYLELVAF